MSRTRAGAPGRSPVSGWTWPRLHQAGSVAEKPCLTASVVTYMTPVRGTGRKAWNGVSSMGRAILTRHAGGRDLRYARPDPAGGAAGAHRRTADRPRR